MIAIDSTASVSALADIENSPRGSLITISAKAMVDSFVKIKVAGGSGDVLVGAGSYINSGTVIYSGNGVRIGANVLISANCTLAAANHAYADPTRPIREQGFMPSRGGIVIEDDVWIGGGSVLLDGAVIRRGAVVGAGSLVRTEVPANAVVAGNPLHVIGRRGG